MELALIQQTENLENIEMKNIMVSILAELKKLNQAKEQEKEYGLVLDVDEAAEFTGLTTSKLYQFGREIKGFPVITEEKKGSRMFFSRDGLREWVKENEGKPIYLNTVKSKG